MLSRRRTHLIRGWPDDSAADPRASFYRPCAGSTSKRDSGSRGAAWRLGVSASLALLQEALRMRAERQPCRIARSDSRVAPQLADSQAWPSTVDQLIGSLFSCLELIRKMAGFPGSRVAIQCVQFVRERTVLWCNLYELAMDGADVLWYVAPQIRATIRKHLSRSLPITRAYRARRSWSFAQSRHATAAR